MDVYVWSSPYQNTLEPLMLVRIIQIRIILKQYYNSIKDTITLINCLKYSFYISIDI